MGLFSKKRYVVANLHLALEGKGLRDLQSLLAETTRKIAGHEGDFQVAAEGVISVVEALLAREAQWSLGSSWGEIFKKEDAAGSYGDESFADAAGRYLSSGERQDDHEESPGSVDEGLLVVMLTVGYEGEVKELERTHATRGDFADALTAIKGLHHRGQLQLVHLHYAPASPDEVLTEDQLLVGYHEMLKL